MKSGIHPTYHAKVAVKCVSCGMSMTTGSTQEEINIEVCSQCHPFFTGKQRLVDTSRRVEKFEKRTKAQEELSKSRITKKEKVARRAKQKAEKASSKIEK